MRYNETRLLPIFTLSLSLVTFAARFNLSSLAEVYKYTTAVKRRSLLIDDVLRSLVKLLSLTRFS